MLLYIYFRKQSGQWFQSYKITQIKRYLLLCRKIKKKHTDPFYSFREEMNKKQRLTWKVLAFSIAVGTLNNYNTKFLKNYFSCNFDNILTISKIAPIVYFCFNLHVFYHDQEHLMHNLKIGPNNIPLLPIIYIFICKL